MEDAFGVAEDVVRLVATRDRNGVDKRGGWEEVKTMLGSGEEKRVVGWKDWLVIDGVERKRGRKLRKEREKITSVVEMMKLLD
jgi:adrenodoxin-NADP+ reductase